MGLVLLASPAFAANGVFGGYIVLDLNGAGSNFYKIENGDDRVTPPFSGVNFGLFDPSVGQTFVLTGGEADTFKNGASDVTGASLNYRIYLTGSPYGAPPAGDYSYFNPWPYNLNRSRTDQLAGSTTNPAVADTEGDALSDGLEDRTIEAEKPPSFTSWAASFHISATV